eukprot:392510_1
MSANSKMQMKDDESIIHDIIKAGYICPEKISDTLQGSIWAAWNYLSHTKVVIKVTNKYLHSDSTMILNGHKCKVYENILKEKEILKHLSKNSKCPDSITKYLGFFKSNENYFLVMQHGGRSFFDFIVKAHQFISLDKIQITEWHKLVKIIFKQMIECIEYIHAHNICHFDISLENFL